MRSWFNFLSYFEYAECDWYYKSIEKVPGIHKATADPSNDHLPVFQSNYFCFDFHVLFFFNFDITPFR